MNIKGLYKELGGELKEFEKFRGEVDKGYKISYEKKVTEVDVQLFGMISGDFSPVHFDEEVASKTRFGGRVAHGMLTTSFVSAALARIPGLVIILDTYFRYTAPVRIGDVVMVSGVVVEADKKKSRFKLDIECHVGEKKVVEGWTSILIW